MRKLIVAVIVCLNAPTAMASEQAENVIDRMLEREAERAANVESFAVMETHFGNVVSVQYYEKVPRAEFIGYRLVSPAELQARANPGAAEAAFETAIRATPLVMWFGGIAIYDAHSDKPLDEAGLEAIDAYGNFLNDMHAAATTNEAEQIEGLIQARKDMREFGREADVVDVKEFHGREAYYLIARGMHKLQKTENGDFTINDLGLIVDTEFYEPLQMRVEGVSKTEEGEQPFVIAQTMLDYNEIEGGSVRIPHKKISLVEFDFMKGKSRKEQEEHKKEMQKAKQQYEEMKAELEKMPPQQRKMMEAMMGNRLEAMEEQLESIVDQHAFGSEAVVNLAKAGNVDTYLELLAGSAGEQGKN